VIKQRINSQDQRFVEAADTIRTFITRSNIILDQDPDMAGLDNRFADIWRPLFAIGDYFGRGEIVRTMAQGITGEYVEYSMGTQLLMDIRIIFDELKIDRIERQHLLNELHKFDRWSDWGRAATFTKNELLSILRDYRVPPVHPIRIDGELVQAWYRSDFEEMWKSI
jgi:hypothetical protein